MQFFLILNTLITSIGIDSATLTKDVVQGRIAEQVMLFPQEKLYLQTDKSCYVAGEQLWFRAYLVDAVLHMPSNRSAYVYLELINPVDSVVSRIRVSQSDGAFSGAMALPETLAEGDYVLRAYTDNLRNLGNDYFFHRNIQLLGPLSAKHETLGDSYPEEAYDVSFYPEGGYLLDGVSCRVAFKALYPDGSPAEISGRLMDRDGGDYGPVETLHAGMGLLDVTAEPGKNYYVICEDGRGARQEFELPAAQENMYSLQVRTVDGELHVSVLRSAGVEAESRLYLMLHTRGMVHYLAPWDTRYSELSFDTSLYPSGVMQILLLDEHANPLSERLYFCRNDDDAKLSFHTDKRAYDPRSLVKAVVNLTDNAGLPLSGSFSVSVTDDLDVSPDSTVHIVSSLLLSAELKGFIQDPSFYLDEGNFPAMDLLMLTHGWRRYNIPDVIQQRYTRPVYPDRHSMEIRGTVKTNLMRKPVVESKVSVFSWQAGYSDETVTDSVGHFVFDGFEATDSLTFVVQAMTPKGRNNLVLDIEQETFPPVSESVFTPVPKSNAAAFPTVDRDHLVEKSNRQYEMEHGVRKILLREVDVNARSVEQKKESYSYYMPKDGIDVLNAEELEKYQPASLSDVIKYLPFVRVADDAESGMKKVIIERMKGAIGKIRYATLIIDDIILNDYDLDNVTDPSNIEKIGVLKGAAAAILGGDGAGGAIVITTKKGYSVNDTLQPRPDHIKWIMPLGVQAPVEFYSPRYETAAQRNRVNGDLRTTIYWNPNVRISSSGKADFEFYTADTNTTYSIVIEGVADNGMLIRNQCKITRK